MIRNNRFFERAKFSEFTPAQISLEEEPKKTGDTTTQPVTDGPKVLTTEEKEEKIANIIKQFVSGNMTRFEAEQELDELGINCASNDNANDRVLNFEFNNKKYQITCSRVAANDGKGGNVVETITPEEVNAVVQKYGDDAKKYFKAVATVDGETTAYALDFTNWPEGVNKTLAALQTELAKPKESAEEKAVKEFIENYTNSETDISGNDFDNLKKLLSAAGIGYKEEQQTVFGKTLRGIEFEFGDVTYNFYTNEAAANAPAEDFTNISPSKFNEAQLAGIDNNAIMRYFTKQDDGTYIMNEANITADFPEAKYGKIDTPEKLKKAIADAAKADTTGSAVGAGGSTGTSGANGTGGTNGAGSVTQPTDAQKSQAKGTVMAEVMKAYMSGNGDYGITTKCSDTRLPSLFNRKLSNAIDEFAKSYTGSADDYLKALQDHIKTAVPTLIQEVENEIKASDTNGAKENTPKVTTYKQAELAGLDANAISTYFTKQSDGTYVMNDAKITADFPVAKYGKIDTPEKLKKAIADSAKADTTGSAAGAGDATGTSGANGTDGTRGNDNTTPATNDNKAADTTDKTEALKTAYKNVNKTISSVANWLGTQLAKVSDKISGKFDYDSSGNIDLKDSNTKTIFNNIVDKLVSEIGNADREEFLETIGGKDGLKKLVQAAWIMAYSSYASDKTDIKTEDFVNKVMENLQKIMQNLQQNPNNLEYLTDDCYKDSDLANTSTTKLNTKEFIKYDNDGLYHLDDDTSDKNFQEAMNTMLEKLYNKYPNISKAKIRELFVKAQGEALTSAKNGTDIPAGCNINRTTAYKNVVLKTEMSVKDTVQLVAYKFDKLFKAECLNSTFPAREVEAKPTAAKSNQTTEQNSAIAEGANGIASAVKYVKDTVVNACKGAITKKDKNNIHTEFGMDSSGNIVFQENDTKAVFDTIFSSLKSSIGAFASDALTKLGGESALKKLVQAAWIAAYNDFDSSQSNNVTSFVNKVMSNLETMINKLKTNPELFEVYTKRSSYADTSVTNNVKHYNKKDTYGGDEKIDYSGNVTTFKDGTVHISNTNDDNDYQSTMSDVLKNLITKYSSIKSDTVTKVFRDAQKKALEACQQNRFDCPYGTGNNSGRVEDWRKDWGGKDNRKKDKSAIDMDQLVQMTLYYFDKLLLKEMMK